MSEQELREAMSRCETADDLRAFAEHEFGIKLDDDKRRDTLEQDILEAYQIGAALGGTTDEITALEAVSDKLDDVIDDLKEDAENPHGTGAAPGPATSDQGTGAAPDALHQGRTDDPPE